MMCYSLNVHFQGQMIKVRFVLNSFPDTAIKWQSVLVIVSGWNSVHITQLGNAWVKFNLFLQTNFKPSLAGLSLEMNLLFTPQFLYVTRITPEHKYHCKVLFVLKGKLAKYKNEAFGCVQPVFMANMFTNLQVVDAFLTVISLTVIETDFLVTVMWHTHTRIVK